MAKILLVEDDQYLSSMVQDALRLLSLSVEAAYDGNYAFERLNASDYELVILDWDLPGMTGLDILKYLRSKKRTTPVIMLTGKSTIDEKELGLESGADDYVTKPFNIRELTARVKSILRRAAGGVDDALRVGSLMLQPKTFSVELEGQKINLVRKEFALLELMMRHPNQVFSIETLLDRIWNFDAEVSPDTVRTTLNRLRKKLDRSGKPPLIETVYGVGYKLISQ